MARQVADAQLRSEGAGAQLGMGEVEIIDPLGDVIGKFIAQGKAEPAGLAMWSMK